MVGAPIGFGHDPDRYVLGDDVVGQHTQAQPQGQLVLQCVLLRDVAPVAMQMASEQEDAVGSSSFQGGRGDISDDHLAKLKAWHGTFGLDCGMRHEESPKRKPGQPKAAGRGIDEKAAGVRHTDRRRRGAVWRVAGKSNPWRLEVGWSSRPAKGVSAVLTLVVVEHIGIDGFANGCAGSTAGRTAEQGAHEGTSQPAKEGPGGTSGHAKDGTGFGASEGSSSATDGSSGSAYSAAYLASVVVSVDLGGVASRASKWVSHIGLMKVLK